MASPTTITAITADPKEPDMRRITSNRTIIARIRHGDVDRMGLRVGLPIDASMVATLDRCAQHAALRLRAIRSLSRAAASRQRLRERLSPHAANASQLEIVLDELIAEGILDDTATATRIAAETLRGGPIGSRGLAAKLQRRGFAATLVDHIVAEQLGSRDECADALEAAKTAMASLATLPPDTVTRRLAARLARKGFSSDAIIHAVQGVGCGPPHLD